MNNGYYAVVLDKKSCDVVKRNATMDVVNGDHITLAYKPNNRDFDKLNKLIDKKDIRSLLKSIQSGHPVYYAPDQNFSYQVNFADFFGQPAATTAGTYKLVQRGVLVVPWFCIQTAPDQWQVDILPPATDWSGLDEQQTANRLNALFESQIRRHPEQYLWVHRRFKNQPGGRPNPYL